MRSPSPAVLALLLVLAPPAVARHLGSDGTYWYADSLEGALYSGNQIDDHGGTALDLDAGDAATLALPWSFPFYGTTWDEITIHSYGVISLGAGENDPGPYTSGTCVADGVATGTFLAPYWYNWDTSSWGDVWVKTYPTAVFVQWADVQITAADLYPQTFGVWIFQTGEIAFTYERVHSGDAYVSKGLIGAEGIQADGGAGISLGCEETSLEWGLYGVWFTPVALRNLAGDLVLEDHAAQRIGGTSASDRLGWSVAATGDTDGDGFGDYAVGACQDDLGAATAGAVYLFPGGTTLDADVSAGDAALAVVGSTAADQLGYALAGGEDLDGDGLSDVVAGIPYSDAGGRNTGAAAVLPGGMAGSGVVTVEDAGWILSGEATNDTAGLAVQVLGDVNGDGYADLAVGAPALDSAATDAGGVYVVPGQGAWTDASLTDAWVTLLGVSASDAAGTQVGRAGDLDADGLQDLLVGAWGTDGTGTDAGAVFVVTAADLSAGTTSLSSFDAIDGVDAGDYAGVGLVGAGDLTGDGLGDLFLGAYGAGTGNAGAAYTVAGATTGWPSSLSSATATFSGATSDRVGFAAATLDLSDTGTLSLAVGAYSNATAAGGAGAVYLLRGDELAVGGSFAPEDAWGTLRASESSGYAGRALSAGDLNGDGQGDLLVGAYNATGDVASAGAVFVVLSHTTWPDEDGDGHLAVSRGGTDCDDADSSLHPDNVETCDGVDDNCDGVVDEGFSDTDGDGTADCIDPEVCDSLDNDGDGLVDEEMADTDLDGLCDALDAEDCDGLDNDGDGAADEDFPDEDADGIADCMDVEVCDGLDNDGDGTVDEEFPDADHDGRADCADWESCDGLDNDGDGTVDEGFSDTDADGLPDCLDEESCDGLDNDGDGTVDEEQRDTDLDGICDTIDAETCDGVDNDGDGHVDEGFSDTDGDGVADCVSGEICDGVDNNGNGRTDEGYPDADGDLTADCVDEEECDGLDNDGDGLVDEGSPDSDYDGTPDCLEQEECDGLDNDGDGDVDEEAPDADGDGAADCIDVETCDGVDNDGDEQVDEDFVDEDGDGVADCLDPFAGPGEDTGTGPTGKNCGGCATGRATGPAGWLVALALVPALRRRRRRTE